MNSNVKWHFLHLFQQSKHIDLSIYIVLLGITLSITNMFLCCYFGKLATESFEKMPDCLYESNWHERSIKLQKYFNLMIQNMQTPLFYHGFNVAVLNLETFTKVSWI